MGWYQSLDFLLSHNSYNSVPCDIIALPSTIWNGKFHFVGFFIIQNYIFLLIRQLCNKSLLVVSPLGKTTRCDPGMLPIVSFPQSKEQATWATKTTSTKKDIARHTVPDCRGRTIDNKNRGCREKREHFCQIKTKKQQFYHILNLSSHRPHSYWASATGWWSYKAWILHLMLLLSTHLTHKQTQENKTQHEHRTTWSLVRALLVRGRITLPSSATNMDLGYAEDLLPWC